MPHWLNHGAVIAGRVFAGLVGCLCLYVAFFMYEDEQGEWQNRLDEFWISTHERSRLTKSTTIALFNKIAENLTRLVTTYFGKELYSVRAVLTSINLSLAVPVVAFSLIGLVMISLGTEMVTIRETLASIPLSIAMILLIMCSTWRWHRWVYLVSSFPALFALLYLLSLPIVNSGVRFRPTPFLHHVYLDNDIIVVTTVLMSFSTDVFVIALIRKLLMLVERTLSPMRITTAALVIGITGFVAVYGPHEAVSFADRLRGPRDPYYFYDSSTDASRIVEGILVSLTVMNASTLLYCLIPVAMLFGLLLHRFVWPASSRLVYPLCKFKIFTNRKTLIAFGTLCLTVALNLEKVGVKEVLKLLS